ncbi:MAG: hypothetical protein M1830_004248 [Pleopsidium flavum]|nr:MAG: hypothetical protein M1830_004248 [Pleopsidium flavum]
MEYSASFPSSAALAHESSNATFERLDRDLRHDHFQTLRPERSQPSLSSSLRLISSSGPVNGASYAYRRENAESNHNASLDETSSLPDQHQVTFWSGLSSFVPRQLSYSSALIGTSVGASAVQESFSYVPGAYSSGIRGSFDGPSDLDNIAGTEGRSGFVPQKHIDVYSDGVYLNTASGDSFLGVSYSPPPPPTTTLEDIRTVQFKKALQQPQTTLTPRSPSRHAKSSCLRSLSTPLSPDQPRDLGFESSTQAHADYPRGLQALSKTVPEVAYDVSLPAKQRISEQGPRGSRRTSVTSYSSLKKGRATKLAHDFEVVIVERESSGESSEYGDGNDLEFSSGCPKEHTAAVKAVNIFRKWKVESIAQEQQRLDRETYGKHEQASGSIRFKTAWTKDLLSRNCQRQIQAKLRDGHVLVLQKLPPSVFKAKITTCAQPCCPATEDRITPASYRLSLEPRENLKRAMVPTDPVYPTVTVGGSDGKVEAGLGSLGKHGATWYCLTCIEDLWNGVGMLQAALRVKKNIVAYSEKPKRIMATKDTTVSYELLAGTLPFDAESNQPQVRGSPEPRKKKAKILLRPPCKPTRATMANSQPHFMDNDNTPVGVERASQKVDPSPQRLLSTRTRKPTAKARDEQDAAEHPSSAMLDKQNFVKRSANTPTSDSIAPRSDHTTTDLPAAPATGLDSGRPLSLDGVIDDDTPIPRPRRQRGPSRSSILQAAAKVGAMVTEEEEEEREAALLATSDRHEADSTVTTPRRVPPGSRYSAEGAMTPSPRELNLNTSNAAPRTPDTSRRITTPRTVLEAARPTTQTHCHVLNDSGYVTEASANVSKHSPNGTLVRTHRSLEERLHRQREVEKILREVESKNAAAAKAKKRKFLNDRMSSSLERASSFKIQSPAYKRARLEARDANGKFLPKVEDLDADAPTLASTRVTNLSRRSKRTLNKDLSQNKAFQVPEYWCTCHQPEDELGMIQCDGEFCLVGWFHLRCTGLAMVPDENDSWYCEACSALYYKPTLSSANTRPHCTYFDGPADSPPVFSSINRTSTDPSLKRRRTHTPPLPHTPPAPPQHPTPLTPALAAIASSIHPETRAHPSGYYTLSAPQTFALQKWKAVITYAQIFANPQNEVFMEKNGLHYGYPEDCPEIYSNDEAGTMRGVMEVGGLVVEVSAEEVRGRELSCVLSGVDERVQRELERVGWVDKGLGMGTGTGKVKLRLRVGKKREREMEMEETGEGEGERSEDMDMDFGK